MRCDSLSALKGNNSRILESVRECAQGLWFSPGIPVSSTNGTDRYDITEILLKVALNTIKPNQQKILFVDI
jgi:hypothetical protein